MSFTEKTASLSKGSVKYHVGGEGRPILYLHSGGGIRVTQPVLDLAENHTVFMMVTPGFDGTDYLDGVDTMEGMAELAKEFIDSEIGEKCDLIGYSFGGWVACWLAVLHGDLVDQIILQAPAGFRGKDAPGLPTDPAEFVKVMYAHPEKIPSEDKPEDVLKHNREAMGHYHSGAPMDNALVARLGEIENLVLVVHGTEDGAIPKESMQLLKSKLNRSHLVYVYDAAHGLEIDQPERVSLLVNDFLARGEGFLVNWGDEAAGFEAVSKA
jgi:pimeloyl-ACP methyl ester carboxylesterase